MKGELFDKLQSHCSLTNDECFDIASEISQKLSSTDLAVNQDGRNLIIRALDNWENISDSYKLIFIDLISAAGFYPYLKNIEKRSFDLGDEIRKEYHRSEHLPDKYFHAEQKKITDLLMQRVNVIVSAPTSFGKSMLIEEIIASGIYKNIVIIQPTLALLDETRRKLKKYSDAYKIIIKTSQSYSNEKGNIFLLTAERVLEYVNLPQIELLILDEFYKLSSDRGDNRSNILNTAFVRIMKNPACRFYMLGPNIDSIPNGFVEKYNAVFYQTDFSMVITELDDKYDQVTTKCGGKVTETDLFNILDSIDEQTLIYCSSPTTARNLAFAYCEHLISQKNVLPRGLPLVDWINDNLEAVLAASHSKMFFSKDTSEHSKLGELMTFGNGKSRPKTDGPIPVYGGNGVLSYTDHHNIENAVLIGRVGAYCGSVYLEQGICWVSDNAIFAKSKITKDEFFDYFLLKRLNLFNHHVGTGQQLLTQEILNNIEVPKPVTEQIELFNRKATSIFETIFTNSREIIRLQELSDLLLSRLAG